MIVVVGRTDSGPGPEIARRVARRGARVELVGTALPDDAGDERLAKLAAAGVGHAAVLRTAATSLEPADLELALRYLPEVQVIVLADAADGLERVAVDAAAWSGAMLVVLSSAAQAAPAGALADAGPSAELIRLEAPAADPDGAFAGLVAELATRLDAGASPEAAWRETSAVLGLERLSPRR